MVIGKSERKRKFRKRRVRSGVREELDSLSEEEEEKERARPPKPKPPVKIPDKPLISPLSDTEISEGLERYVFLIFNVKGSHGKEGVHGGGEGGGVLGRKELGCFKFRLKKAILQFTRNIDSQNHAILLCDRYKHEFSHYVFSWNNHTIWIINNYSRLYFERFWW